MPAPVVTESAPHGGSRLACAALVLATVVAYANSFAGPFVLDDPSSIVDNPSIRQLWPPWVPLSPPHGAGLSVEGRPVLNLSLAFNYAFGGTHVWGYHAVNLAIHVLAGLTLFGLVRCTVAAFPRASAPPPTLFALAVALVWTLHPLQTESVTYIVQRAESLMGLFYLLTLGAFVRAVQSPRGAPWLVLSVATCALGMATKEVMVTAPVVVLLYDHTFVAGSIREAWRRRRAYYAALAGTWLVLLWLVLGAGNRGGTIGTAAGVAWWDYALTQSRALVHYLTLILWPRPLVFDYGSDFVLHALDVVPHALLDLALLGTSAFGLWRRSVAGFLGVCFFVLLAPTSSFIGGTRQMLAEHRLYLPLAAVTALAMLGLHAAWGRRGPLAGLIVAMGLGVATAYRNADYRDPLTLWSDTVANRPGNAWAQNDLGTALLDHRRAAEAVDHFFTAVRLKPGYADAHHNLANALLQLGRVPEALDHYQRAVQLQPAVASAHADLGHALLQSGRPLEAMASYETTLRLDPDQPEVHNNLGNLLAAAHRDPEAIAHYEASLHLRPTYAEAAFNLANALSRENRLPEAITHYERALHLRPAYAAAHGNLANALLALGRVPEAIDHDREAVRLKPADALAHYNLANALLRAGRRDEAIGHYQEALRLHAGFSEARGMLTRLRANP